MHSKVDRLSTVGSVVGNVVGNRIRLIGCMMVNCNEVGKSNQTWWGIEVIVVRGIWQGLPQSFHCSVEHQVWNPAGWNKKAMLIGGMN